VTRFDLYFFRHLPPVSIIARETKFPIRADGFFASLVFILPNVLDQTRPALARNMRLGAYSVTA
jgi:hypothetical protein